jgi:hypothetical protein
VHVTAILFLALPQVNITEEGRGSMLHTHSLQCFFLIFCEFQLIFFLPLFKGNLETVDDHTSVIDAFLQLYQLFEDELTVVFD